KKEVEETSAKRKSHQAEIDQINDKINKLLPEKDKADLKLADFKANLDSKKSFYDIAAEHGDTGSIHAINLKNEIKDLGDKVAEARSEVEKLNQQIKGLQRERDQFEAPLTVATGKLKKL